MVARGRWASPARPLVCRHTGLVMSRDCPVARPRYGLSARDGSSAPEERKTKEQSSPVCSTGDQRHLSGEPGCRTAGCERGLVPTQVATRLQRQKISLLRIQRGPVPEELASSSERVQAVRLRSGSRDCGAVKLLSTQIVRKQAKAIFHLQRRGTLRATSSSTLSNSTNGWPGWQRRS